MASESKKKHYKSTTAPNGFRVRKDR